MARLQPVRGTHDLLPEDARRHRHVTETARRVAATYGFEEMATPIFEFTEVFARTLGEATDVVSKEMYSFDDRSGDSLTLRPEGTAGVARALISNGLTQQLPAKYFYQGPMFRHERPQKGRQRQFHQIGVELLGVADPVADVEVIACGQRILDRIGLTGTVVLEINTLGDQESRSAYREALVAYLSRHRETLSEDSRDRLERNPLRVLDSKDKGDRAVVADAPAFDDYLTPAATEFFAAVTGHLDRLGIAYRRNPRLVRGLDYYCHTTFEFVSDGLGAQATVMAGGRYDGLVEMLGGPSTPGVGWAAGVERLALLLAEAPAAPRPVAIVPVGDDLTAAAVDLAERLRGHGLPVDLGYSGNVGRRLKRADRIGARLALLLGADEAAQGVVTLRDLDSGTQETVAGDAVAARCAALLGAGPLR